MHAYLITGLSAEEKLKKAESIAKKSKATVYNFELKKIADVRNLEKFLKFYPPGKTAILIKDIDKATIDAQNSFLKSLEEKDQFIFCLTAVSKNSTLPTIVSRCEVVSVQPNSQVDNSKVAEFLEMEQGERLLFLDEIKARPDAQNFIDSLLTYGQQNLKSASNRKNLAAILKQALEVRKALQANTNVLLQLTNFVVSLDGQA